VGHLPAELAKSLGFYQEEGLKVSINYTSGSSKVMEAILGQSADVACAGQTQAIQLAVEGKAVRCFVAEFNNHGYSLVASPSASQKITRIEDLKGAAVGVTALGSGTQQFLDYLLVKHGLSPQDVSTVGVGAGASNLAALERGQVAASVADLATLVQLKKRHPELVVLADTSSSEGMSRIFGSASLQYALCARAEWLEQNPETARKMARAIVRTLHWIHDHSPAEVRDQMPESFRTNDTETDLEVMRIAISMYSTDGVLSEAAAKSAKDLLDASLERVRAAKVDLSNIYTNEFVPSQEGHRQ
jgi:NitT/TauT family transport system substrate-binding protein